MDAHVKHFTIVNKTMQVYVKKNWSKFIGETSLWVHVRMPDVVKAHADIII